MRAPSHVGEQSPITVVVLMVLIVVVTKVVSVAVVCVPAPAPPAPSTTTLPPHEGSASPKATARVHAKEVLIGGPVYTAPTGSGRDRERQGP